MSASRKGVSLFYCSSHQLTTFDRREILPIFNSAHGGGKALILDRFDHPQRIMMLPEVIYPGCIVHPFSQLHEERQIVRPKIELPTGARKVEASVHGQFPLGVLSPMPLPL